MTRYMSVLSLRHAAEPDHWEAIPKALSVNADGSTSSTRLECLQMFGSTSCLSERQSVKNMEPRQSETRKSLLVDGWEQMEVRGWGNGMT